jgi:hypothetical protein
MQRPASTPSLFIALGGLSFATLAFAETARTSVDLDVPSASSASFAQGGNAIVSDVSAADANPAGLGLGRAQPSYIIGTETQWMGRTSRLIEAGIVDTSSSDVSAALKARRTTRATGANMYKFSVGLSEPLENIPLYVGLSADYITYEKPANDEEKKANWHAGMGLIYQVSPNLFLGGRTSGWVLNKETPRTHAVGLTWLPSASLIVSADALFSDKTVTSYVGSGSYSPTAWLDLMGGYGYEVDSKRHRATGTLGIKSEKFRISYTLTKPSDVSERLRHSINCSMNALAVDKN